MQILKVEHGFNKKQGEYVIIFLAQIGRTFSDMLHWPFTLAKFWKRVGYFGTQVEHCKLKFLPWSLRKTSLMITIT